MAKIIFKKTDVKTNNCLLLQNNWYGNQPVQTL